jgi:hypothetical protein
MFALDDVTLVSDEKITTAGVLTVVDTARTSEGSLVPIELRATTRSE